MVRLRSPVSLRFHIDPDSPSRRRDSRSVSKDPFCNGSVPVCQLSALDSRRGRIPSIRRALLWDCELAPAITPGFAASGTRPLLQGAASVAAQVLF